MQNCSNVGYRFHSVLVLHHAAGRGVGAYVLASYLREFEAHPTVLAHSYCTVHYVLVITWRGGMLLVYSARRPRARSARGGGRNKPQHTDNACHN